MSMMIDRAVTYKIDFLRGLLCQYVILGHMIPAIFPGVLGNPGTLAVWGFFILSGYLNYYSCLRSKGPIEYFCKRVFRLYPLLFVSCAIVMLSEYDFFVNDIYTIVPYVLLIKKHMPNNGVLWTLIIELQLYLLTPFLVRIIHMYTDTRGMRFEVLIIILWIMSIIFSISITKWNYGYIDLDDRTFLGALPFYIFGMILVKLPRPKFHWLCKLFSIFAFILVLLDRNLDYAIKSRLVVFKHDPNYLYWIGRVLPYIYVPWVIFDTRFELNVLFRGFCFLGKATYEIYLLHGLMAFLMTKYYPNVGHWSVILISYWLVPTTLGLIIVNKKYLLCIMRPFHFQNV